jgi:hypothetical protein
MIIKNRGVSLNNAAIKPPGLAIVSFADPADGRQHACGDAARSRRHRLIVLRSSPRASHRRWSHDRGCAMCGG